jgi:hypothetical protein
VRSRGPAEEVTLMVHDDGPVGLDQVRVVFKDLLTRSYPAS